MHMDVRIPQEGTSVARGQDARSDYRDSYVDSSSQPVSIAE